jgi:hypothetical protein
MAQLTPEEIAVEAAQRPRAAYVAFAAGVLSLLGGVGALLFGRSLPTSTTERVVDLLEALEARVVENTAPPRSLNAVQVEYLGDHLVGWVGPSLATSVGVLLLIVPVGLLFKATRARKDDMRQLGGVMLVIGAAFSAIGLFGYTLAVGLEAQSFEGTSAAQARDVLTTQTAVTMQVIGLIGRFALALGLIVISLNAMRAGLLTRFVGVLGIIVGAAVIIPVPIDQINLLRSSFLIFLGLILLGKMPGAYQDPPAWGRGEMIPWPSQQEIRERRDAERAAAGRENEDEAGGSARRSRKRRT